MRAGQDIVLTGWTGLAGTLAIIQIKDSELKERFAPFFLKQIKGYAGEMHTEEELMPESAQAVVREVGEGGIFAALWRLAKESGTGMTVDMKRISIRQETIEICEFYRLNPYQLYSGGSFLVITDDGQKMSEELGRRGIFSSVIGRLTDSNDKILRNVEEIRFIDRPAPDEIEKVYKII